LNTIKLLAIFLLGMVAYHIFLGPHVPPKVVESDAAPEEMIFEEPETTIVAERKATAVSPVQKNIPKKHFVDLTFSESLIAQMEYDWNILPLQAEAKREERGWRFVRVNEGTPFAQAGLRPGDLVTTEFLDNLRNSNSQLVLRLEHVFNKVSR
jgi:hypothetical protein